MKLLLIKIGKAFHTLKREGLIRGGRRVLTAFLAMFRRVRSGDILFVTGGVGDSARYRCHHVAEELESHKFKTSITVQDNPLLPLYADQFSVFIFHRVLFTPSVAKLIGRIKGRGKEIIFETDDLVYDSEYLAHMDYYQVMNPLERKLYEHGVGGEILADPYVKVATTTTSYLADKLREKGKQVFVVPNRLSKEDVRIADKLYEECHPERIRESRNLHTIENIPWQTRDDEVTLAYFSGSASHNKDFATIVEPLLVILEKHANVELALYGPLDIDPRFDRFGERVKRTRYVQRKKHWENVARADINLAPLEVGNPFCESKSELKFFEAGIVGVPTVAAATRTFQEAIRDGEDGFVATTPEEWAEKLGKLIADVGLRKRIGEAARKTALAKYTTETSNDEYLQYLRERVG